MIRVLLFSVLEKWNYRIIFNVQINTHTHTESKKTAKKIYFRNEFKWVVNMIAHLASFSVVCLRLNVQNKSRLPFVSIALKNKTFCNFSHANEETSVNKSFEMRTHFETCRKRVNSFFYLWLSVCTTTHRRKLWQVVRDSRTSTGKKQNEMKTIHTTTKR